MESLKGPALEIAKAVHTSNPDATPAKYLDALESAFGTAETGDDLYFAFRLMQQQHGEKLSDFLRQLEHSLSKVIHYLPHSPDWRTDPGPGRDKYQSREKSLQKE